MLLVFDAINADQGITGTQVVKDVSHATVTCKAQSIKHATHLDTATAYLVVAWVACGAISASQDIIISIQEGMAVIFYLLLSLPRC